jgi:catechol 2,3-dioxygenase-like lactoylglutathione lyase family enzyme
LAPSEALRFPESEALGGDEIARIPDQVATFFMLVDMTVQRMDNVGIVVDDLDAAAAFFTELGMELEGTGQIEGLWADRTVGLDSVRSDIAMMRTPDGHSKLELTKYHTAAASGAKPENPPPNTLGLHRVMFAVDDIDDTIARLRAPRRRTPRRCGAVREHLPALLPPRPRGHHRRSGRTDRLTRSCSGASKWVWKKSASKTPTPAKL